MTWSTSATNKPARDYDDFVAVAITDIERWWDEHSPPCTAAVRADRQRHLRRVPRTQSDLPGCGEPTTRYEDLNQYVAFYCQDGDFMIYDDGDESLLKDLADNFGPAVMGIVLAHEYGHAIQQRTGALDEFLATIYTEQQADCFAGAWTGQAYRGESPLLRLGDADVRAGLIAMLEVRDPVGHQPVRRGRPRVGVRPRRCLPGGVRQRGRALRRAARRSAHADAQRVPAQTDARLGGNAPYDCEELRNLGATDAEIADCVPAPSSSPTI